MKVLGLIMILIFAVGCGDDVTNVHRIVMPADKSPSFSGYFNLDGGSDTNCIFLSQKATEVVDIETDCQSLVSLNPENSTLGQFPTISATNLIVVDGEIRYTRNLNFTSGNDIEEDVSGSNITGNRRVDVLIKMVDGKLVMKLSVFANANNNNLNYIVATRIFNEI